MAVSDTVRLRLYNEVLRLHGDKRLSSVNEQSESRRILDDVWEQDPVRYVLEKALWKFARRTVSVSADASLTTISGWEYGFLKPDDVARVAAVSETESFSEPFLTYQDEGEYWYANVDPIFVSYVSFDGDFGYNTELWTKTFEHVVAAYMATKSVKRLTKEGLKLGQDIDKYYRKLLLEAKANDAQLGPTRFLPEGRFVRARGYGGSRRHRDGGYGGPY